VISLAVENGGRTFVGELDGGEAYVDVDWLSGLAAGPAPALFVREGALVSSWDGQTLSLPDDKPTELSVGAALMLVAAAAATEAGAAERPAVAGRGFVAGGIRLLLGSEDGGKAPDLIVETRGDPASLVESTQRVADLGTVVLAGAPAVDPFTFDLYPDVHVRGLRIFALPLALVEDLPDAEGGRLVMMEAAKPVRLGEPIADARWYRITSG
jgi:hypothetical protein